MPGTDRETIFSALPGPALVLRGATAVLANENGSEVFGGDPADPLAPLDAHDRVALGSAAERAAALPVGATVEVTVRTTGPGPRRFFDVALGPFRTAVDGEGTGSTDVALALVHEATEVRRADAALCEVATGVFVTDADLGGRWMPRRVAEVLGLDPAAFPGTDVLDLVHPDDHGTARAVVERAVSTPGVKFAASMRILHPEVPGVFWPIVAFVTWLPHDDAVAGLLVRFDAGLAADLHHDPLEHPMAGMITLGDASPIGFLNLSLGGRLVQRSTRVREILRPVGVDESGADWQSFVRAEDRALVDGLLAAGRAGELRPAAEVGFAGNGTHVWVRMDVLPYRDHDGTIVGTFVNFLDVTAEHEAVAALAAAREELWHLANHDVLTGLWNRVPFAGRLARALDGTADRPDATERPAVLVCDLDGFKEVNDLHGHRVGDDVLVEAARRLGAAVRDGDVVCRFGGDEFLVLCERVTPEGLSAVADRIVESLSEPVVVDGRRVSVGVSVGGALAEPGDEGDPDGLVLRADRAMYRAKAAGRARAVLAH
jgi:diguanylate cyclase (GGDEF)-like protein